jgi:hypothetical protein
MDKLTNQGINHLLNDNQAALDRVAFKLRLAALLEASYEPLRSELSAMAQDNPHLCLQLCSAILHELQGLSPEFAGEKRKLAAFFTRKALTKIEARIEAQPEAQTR